MLLENRNAIVYGGFGVACGAIETFSRVLVGEIGERGVRVVCLRSDALPETWPPMVDDDGAVIPLGELPHGRFMLEDGPS